MFVCVPSECQSDSGCGEDPWTSKDWKAYRFKQLFSFQPEAGQWRSCWLPWADAGGAAQIHLTCHDCRGKACLMTSNGVGRQGQTEYVLCFVEYK